MKKICIVTTVSLTMNAFIKDAAIYLHNEGNLDITLICDNDDEFAASLPEYIRYIPVKMNRGIDWSLLSSIISFYKIFKREKFDLVQFSTPNASFYAGIAAKLAKVPIRLYCQWGIAYVGFSGIKKKIFKHIEKTVCSLATWVEPDSNGNLQFCRAEGLYSDKKSSVIWNGSASGVNLDKFDISKKNEWLEEIRTKLDIPKEDTVFGFVGRINGDKGINELFAAFKGLIEKYDDIWLIMVGNPEKSYEISEELYNWATNEKRVVFCGFTNCVEKYLSAMDVFVLPSYREGFGSSVVEAEAMGVPVIVTDIPGPTDAMVENVTGLLVKKKDVKTLSDAAEELYINKKKRKKLGEAAYKFAVDNFEQKELFRHILEDRKRLLNINCLQVGKK